MRIVLLSNASSGRGNAGQSVARVHDALMQACHDVTRLAVPGTGGDRARFSELFRMHLSACDALIIAGGDGTVHHALPQLAQARLPVYHMPMGTENLFARHFRMTRKPNDVLAALQMPPRFSDLAVMSVTSVAIAARPFAIMLSIGPDARVIQRLALARTGAITHASYALPVLAELWNAWLPRVSVRVDDRPLLRSERGMLLIGNSPEYALRINPARRARVDDGLLDVVFMPARSGLGAGLWLARALLRQHLASDGRFDGCTYAQGKHVTVHIDDRACACQMDGEHVHLPPGPLTLDVHALPHALHLAMPPAPPPPGSTSAHAPARV